MRNRRVFQSLDDRQLPHFFAAPIAEITTPAFRRLIRCFSKNVILFSEMISARALNREGLRNQSICGHYPYDDPIIYQLLGNDPDVMASAASGLSENGMGIDINMGCSAPEIRNQGLGSALLKDIPLALNIVRSCRFECKGTLSVKMRAGFEKNDENFVLSFIEKLAEEGVDFVTLHARSAKDAFRRTADWGLIEKAARLSPIPVVGNGDISDYSKALQRLGIADGIMVARSLISSPWLFRQIEVSQEGGGVFVIPQRKAALDMIQYTEEMLPSELHKSRLHRFFAYYSRNMIFGHSLFSEIRKISGLNEIKSAVEGYFIRNPEEIEKQMIIQPFSE